MRYYKKIRNGYLGIIGTGAGGIEITEQEYNALLDLIRNKPAPPDNTHDYRITEAGEYEFVEVEPIPEPTEATADEVLDILRGDMQ